MAAEDHVGFLCWQPKKYEAASGRRLQNWTVEDGKTKPGLMNVEAHRWSGQTLASAAQNHECALYHLIETAQNVLFISFILLYSL